MKMCDGFEVVNVAEEYLVVPIGENADKLKGVVVINEAVAFLLRNMRNSMTEDELTSLLMEEYDVDKDKASKDVKEMIVTLQNLGLITE